MWRDDHAVGQYGPVFGYRACGWKVGLPQVVWDIAAGEGFVCVGNVKDVSEGAVSPFFVVLGDFVVGDVADYVTDEVSEVFAAVFVDCPDRGAAVPSAAQGAVDVMSAVEIEAEAHSEEVDEVGHCRAARFCTMALVVFAAPDSYAEVEMVGE